VIPHSRPWLDAADQQAVDAVLLSGMIAQGVCVQDFERAVGEWTGTGEGIACTSGTAALILALKTLGIRAGDEVVLPTYVCWNVLAAVTAVGATPRLCDVNQNGVITAQTAQAALTARTKAIVAVHIFGHPCDIASLNLLGLPVIEDACQAFGLDINGSRAGSLGSLGILSFHATKCLTTGEGGMLISKSHDLLEQARALTSSADHANATSVSSITDLQAALGLSQLARYSDFLSRRRQLLASYHKVAERLVSASPGYCGTPSFLFRYTLRTQRGFEAVKTALHDKGIQVRRGVDDLLHRRLGLNERDFPVAADLFAQTVSIPFYPCLSEEDGEKVLSGMWEVFGGA
jgi:UDP-4-amino-4-deoxy-L-arabinose-oxoglutarate aminotransferase